MLTKPEQNLLNPILGIVQGLITMGVRCGNRRLNLEDTLSKLVEIVLRVFGEALPP